MKASIYLLFALIFALFTESCKNFSGLVNDAGRVLDGSAFDEKTIKTYKSADKSLSVRLVSTKDGDRQIVFVLNRVPFVQFYCTEPDQTGLFFITRVHFLFSSAGGWLEGDAAVSGTGLIVETASPSGGNTTEFSLQGPVSFTAITRGGIRRYDKRLYGRRALAELRNREERIRLVTRWMKEQSPPALLASPHDFENYWRPVLLPETVGKKLRPPRYTELSAAQNESNAYSFGGDIKWNTAYTKELFPEHLRQLRDGGSLLRDWEEAALWFYADYFWNTIIRDLCEKHYLNQ
ncbi:MAG: hypothetical protein LBO04_08195 [Spirochaetaceae bacterium]|jgi:hypothetical protein|nr:hypothetical protein [Spirochaetaceae bacterium]